MRALTRGRLVRIALAFALAGCAGSSATHTSRAAASKPVAAVPHNAAVISVSQRATSRAIAPGFLGFSFENNAILPYAGTDPHAINPLFVQLIRNLNPGQAPDLRIGGDSSDWAWVPTPGVSKPGGVRVTLDSQWMSVMHALASTLNARLIMGIDLEANSHSLAAAEANTFEKRLGKSSIEALEPGNEPELYPVFSWYVAANGQGVKGRPPSYNFNSFLGDFTSFAKVLPGPLAGPTTGAPKWMAHTAQFLSAEPRVKVVTLHRYPVQTCYIRKTSPQYPTAAHLLAPYATTRMANSVAGFVRISHARHLPVRIDEMNTDSCGKAPGVSDAFVSSLWAVDALFEMARVGVDGVNMHTYPGATYQMFTFTQQGGRWRTTVKPEYYGLMLFAQAAPAGSRLVGTSTKNARGIVTWATHGADGHTRVVLINQSLNRRAVALNGGSAAATSATLTRLQAPRLSSTSGVTLGGQHFGATTGTLTGRSSASSVAPQGGRYVFSLPAHSAVLVTY